MNLKKAYLLKLLLILVMFIAFKSSGFAQAKFGGQIFENHTKIPIGGVVVENLNTHEKAISDENGMFIYWSLRSRTYFCFQHRPMKATRYTLLNLDYMAVRLDLINRYLNEVKVTGQELKIGKLSPMVETGPLGSQSVLYQVDADGNYIGGVRFMLNDSKGYQKKKLQKVADRY